MERTRASSTSFADSETVCIEILTKPPQIGEKFAELEVKNTYSLCPIKYKNRLNIDSIYLRNFIKDQPNTLRVSYGDGTAYASRGKMQHIGKQFRCMQVLQKLNVKDSHHYFSWITNGGVKHLGESLKYIPSLKALNISFEQKDDLITDWDLQILSHGLKSLKTLQNFNLKINFSNKISDRSLEYLSDGLKTLKLLKSISLNFLKCSQIDDAGLAFISGALKHLTSIENFNFDFSHCNKISDQGLQSLSEGLKHLTLIQNIALNFSFCIQITDNGLANLSEGFKQLSSLNNIGLCFDKCNKITNKGLRSFNEELKSIVSLQNIKLQRQRRTREERRNIYICWIVVSIILVFFIAETLLLCWTCF